jgi:uncharacterized protein (TIRG00374 family)
MPKRLRRAALTLAVTGLCAAYIVWRIDVSKAARELGRADYAWFALSAAVTVASVFPIAWRWQRLLAARGIHERLSWLTRAYFVGYSAGQVLPTSLGGDATRVVETSRRHPGTAGPVTGSVVVERALGAAATLVLAAAGFALAVGRYHVGGYVWLELAIVVGAIFGGVVFFSRRARGPLAATVPLLRRLRVERPLRALYEGVHGYREHAALLGWMFALTLVVQAVRILGIWATGKAVGVDLSPRPYYVMGPLLFLVMLVPFTVNGLAVREAFFVSFLGQLGVDHSLAFDTGFLFFLVTIALSLPGLGIVAWEALHGGS